MANSRAMHLLARGGPRRAWAHASVFVLALAALAACGGSRPTFEQGVYSSDRLAFRVPPPPPEWRRLDVRDATLAFRDDARGASILLNGRCEGERADVPLPALTNHLLMGTTQRDFIVQEVIPLDGREALHTKLRAKLDGVLMAYDLYVLKKDGCIYDFVYVAEPASFDAGTPAFETFVLGFRTQPRRGA